MTKPMEQPQQAVLNITSEQGTVQFAQQLARCALPGTVIALDGDLGAGKTRFSQAFAKAIGVEAVVNSPTFTIIKEYAGSKLPFYHMDVYRISIEEADELGLDDYFFGDGVTMIEWASVIEPLLPEARLEIYIEHLGGERRSLTLTGIGEPYASWLQMIGSEGEAKQ